MTGALVVFLTGITLGATPPIVLWRREAEAHHWRRTRLEAIRVDVLCHDCDHNARLARRLADSQAELREGVGDLLDTVAHQRDVIDQLTEPPFSPVPAYGPHRQEVRA